MTGMVFKSLVLISGFAVSFQIANAQSSNQVTNQRFLEGYFLSQIKPKCVIPAERRGLVFNNTDVGKHTHCFTADQTSLRSVCKTNEVNSLLLSKANSVCDLIQKEIDAKRAAGSATSSAAQGLSGTAQNTNPSGGGASVGGGGQAVFGGTAPGSVQFCGVQGCGGAASAPKFSWMIPVHSPNAYSGDRMRYIGMGYEDGKYFNNEFAQPEVQCDASTEGQMISVDFGYKQNYAVMCLSDKTAQSEKVNEYIKKLENTDPSKLKQVEGVTLPKYEWVVTQKAEDLNGGFRICNGNPICTTENVGALFDSGPSCAKYKCARTDEGGPVRKGLARKTNDNKTNDNKTDDTKRTVAADNTSQQKDNGGFQYIQQDSAPGGGTGE